MNDVRGGRRSPRSLDGGAIGAAVAAAGATLAAAPDDAVRPAMDAAVAEAGADIGVGGILVAFHPARAADRMRLEWIDTGARLRFDAFDAFPVLTRMVDLGQVVAIDDLEPADDGLEPDRTRLRANGLAAAMLIPYLLPDGTRAIVMYASTVPIAWATGAPGLQVLADLLVAAAARDALFRLSRSESSFATKVAEVASDVFAVVSADFTIQYVSPAVLPLLGLPAAAVIGRPLTAILEGGRDSTPIPGRPNSFQTMIERPRPDGTVQYLEAVAFHEVDEHGQVLARYSSTRDVTERVRAERFHLWLGDLERLVLDTAGALLSATPPPIERAVADAFGRLGPMLGARGIALVVVELDQGGPMTRTRWIDPVGGALSDTAVAAHTAAVMRRIGVGEIVHIDGATVPGSGVGDVVGVPLVAQSELLGALVMPFGIGPDARPPYAFDEASARLLRALGEVVAGALLIERMQRRLTVLADHDPLTALPNRRVLEDALDERLARTTRPLAVLLVDLDGFKSINDRHGHLTGDAVLAVVGSRLRRAIGPDDVVGRFGGDEFVVVAEVDAAAASAEAAALAEAVRAELTQPIGLGDLIVEVGASIGLVLATAGEHPSTVLRDADAALYEAKATGRNRTVTGRLTAEGTTS